MEHDEGDHVAKLRRAMSAEAYEASSADDILAKVSGPKPARPPASVDLLKLNKGKINEAAELGMTKMEAATVVACDPRNTGKLAPTTLARDMEKVVGKWSAFKKNLLLGNSKVEPTPTETARPETRTARQAQEVPAVIAASPQLPYSNPFLDKIFDGEGEL